jgi:hypothetical protein
MSSVEPSAYVPVAVNCRVKSTGRLVEASDVITMEDNAGVDVVIDVDVDVDVDEQDTMTKVNIAIIPIVRQ